MIQFVYNVAGTLEFYCPEGVPSGTASLRVYKTGDSAISGTWPQTVAASTANTTTSASASEGGMSLTLTSATGFSAGERYWVQTTTGQRFEIKAVGIAVSTKILYLDQPLRVAVPSGSAIASAKYTYTLTSAQNGELWRRYRAVWSYTVSGVARTATQYYSVVREPFNILISEEDLEKHDPVIGEYLDRYNAWSKLIPGAHEDIERMLAARQLYPDLIRDRDGLKHALIFRILGKFHISISGQESRGERWLKMSEQAIEDVLKSRAWYDADDDHTVSEAGRTTVVLPDGTVTYYYDDDAGCAGDELIPPAGYARVG
jgi:hypothetical protein